MNVTGYKRLTVTLSIGACLLLCFTGRLFWNYEHLKLEVAFAKEQTDIFEEMRTKALQADPKNAVGFLQYAWSYYPSGTKQEKGSRLDLIVEKERSRCVKDIIAHLRESSGQDLGDDPQKWIDKFLANKN